MTGLSVADVLALGMSFMKSAFDTPSSSDGRPAPKEQGSLGSPSPVRIQGSERTDEQLMVAHLAGDAAAFRQLYQRYVDALLRMMSRRHAGTGEERDLVQLTFLHVHRARADYDPGRSFRPWLYRIARNLSHEALRKRRHTPLLRAVGSLAEPTAVEPSPETTVAARAVRAALQSLPPEQREVIELHWFDGLPFPEIAQCLGVPANTAKVRAHRGYKGLRELLK